MTPLPSPLLVGFLVGCSVAAVGVAAVQVADHLARKAFRR